MTSNPVIRDGVAGWFVEQLCPRCSGTGTHRCQLCAGAHTTFFLPEPLVREMQYTTWEGSCKDPFAFSVDLRECRRPAHHGGPHASGFMTSYKEWGHSRAT